MAKIIWFPVTAYLLIGFPDKLATNQNPQHNLQIELDSLPLFADSYQATVVNISETIPEIDAETALNLVWNLPLVQRKSREIQRLSKGKIRVDAIVDGYPTPDNPYYTVSVFEDEPDYNTTIYWFRVLNTGDVIEALDVIDNKYISLAEWRAQLKR